MDYKDTEIAIYKERIKSYGETVEAYFADLVAARKERDELMDTVERMTKQIEAAQAERDRLREACERVIEWHDEDGLADGTSREFAVDLVRDTLRATDDHAHAHRGRAVSVC